MGTIHVLDAVVELAAQPLVVLLDDLEPSREGDVDVLVVGDDDTVGLDALLVQAVDDPLALLEAHRRQLVPLPRGSDEVDQAVRSQTRTVMDGGMCEGLSWVRLATAPAGFAVVMPVVADSVE
jgi:hypothetical protein